MGHDHTTAAVALEAELIEGITNRHLLVIASRGSEGIRRYGVPIGNLLAIDQLEVSLPEITHHLRAKCQ